MKKDYNCTPIELDKMRLLRYSMGAVVAYESRRPGKTSIFDYMVKLMEALGVPEIGAIQAKYKDELDAGADVKSVIEAVELKELGEKFLENLDASALRLLLWAGLVHEDPHLTLEQTTDLMEHAEGDSPLAQYGYIFNKVLIGLMATQGPQKKTEGIATTTLETPPPATTD